MTYLQELKQAKAKKGQGEKSKKLRDTATLATYATLVSGTQETPEINCDIIPPVDSSPENIQPDIPNRQHAADLTQGSNLEQQNDTPLETLLDDHRALAVDFLVAVEALLVTVKDERPKEVRTPHLNRDLKHLEAELTAWRAVLIPDEPESHATGDSLAEQYRAREGVN